MIGGWAAETEVTGRLMHRVWWVTIAVLLSLSPTSARGQDRPPAGPSPIGVEPSGTELRVSADGHHIVRRDGGPFFYLADTCWELFSRTTRDDAVRYLDDRKGKRFTVIQTAFLALARGPNAYGHEPVRYGDLTPLTTAGDDHAEARAYDYWDHVDYVLREATARGFVVAVAPFRQQLMPKLEADAERYGRFLGERYGRLPNLIWMVGFDPSAEQIDARADTYRAVARGIAAGASGGVADDTKVFLTFHPAGRHSSSRWFHDDPWLRFNMVQSGHGRDTPSWRLIEHDYAKAPAKPVLDAEATYEGHPLGNVARDPKTGKRVLSDDADVRKYAYWALLAGACGHTYGHHSVWQMYVPGRHEEDHEAVAGWKEALDAPGAEQMRHVRALIESRPLLSRVPDQLLVEDTLDGSGHIRAARGDGYAFVYTPEGSPFTVVLGRVSGGRVRGLWFDPKSGASVDAGESPNRGTRVYTPPTTGRGNDWVLILDDVAKRFSAPGAGD